MAAKVFVVMCTADDVAFPLFVTSSRSHASDIANAMRSGKTATEAHRRGVRVLRFDVAEADFVDIVQVNDLLQQWTQGAIRRGIKLEGI